MAPYQPTENKSEIFFHPADHDDERVYFIGRKMDRTYRTFWKYGRDLKEELKSTDPETRKLIIELLAVRGIRSVQVQGGTITLYKAILISWNDIDVALAPIFKKFDLGIFKPELKDNPTRIKPLITAHHDCAEIRINTAEELSNRGETFFNREYWSERTVQNDEIAEEIGNLGMAIIRRIFEENDIAKLSLDVYSVNIRVKPGSSYNHTAKRIIRIIEEECLRARKGIGEAKSEIAIPE